MRVRLALLLLTAGLLLPRAADAQVMREYGAFAGSENFGYPAPNPPGGFGNFANGNGFGGMGGGPMFATPPPMPGFGGAPYGAGNIGGPGMQSNPGWSAVPPGLAGAGRLGMRQAFAGSAASSQTETAQATFLAMTQFTQTLLDPAIDGRGLGRPEFDTELSNYADLGNDRTHGGIGREAYAAIYGKPSLAAPHWSIWAAGFGGSQATTDGNGSSARSYATAVGADYSLSPQTRMGFALAGGGTGFANSFSSGRSDLFQAGTFVRRSIGAAYVATALAYGWQAITSDRQTAIAGGDQLSAAVNANAYSSRIESGYRIATPWLGVTPYVAGQVTMFRLAAYTGQSSYADPSQPSAISNSFTDGRSELGLRTSMSFVLAGSLLDLRGRVAWAHDFSAMQAMPAVFQAISGQGSGQGFVIGTAALAPNSALTGVALELRGMNGWSASANFDSELSSLVRAYTGKAIVRYAW
ncbi:autotransporter outer membrane beta-barrel domain-containing protein [Bradyrhizobium arachidis]|uniref:autotransporter outer membrane beta-barrel domain-containing protein n=1 Tax=Bradyrhizobium arachidis TaxID=858423 RepID=UPI002161EAC2|nr:autotransporter outer membrane beta-barrel domain-containing protein [Bradyrhizobium arachidis]UVO33689.1 autotransporter outer membrane beta-barrel domain-containing protein [Bradyrhizobium arachidis]